ncbi:MAG TPA: hypothetical protein VL424_04920 [Pararobbsia sp.]|nr:hypothetical protein [Pararobbsia sp.]
MRQAIPVWPYGALAELADIRRVTAVGLYGAAAGVTYYSVCLLRHISRINMYESPFRSMTHLAMGQYVVVVAGAVAGALNSAAVVHLQARLPHEREATVISGAVDGMVAFGFFGFATAVHGYIRRMEAAVYPGDAYPDNAVSRGPVFGGYLTDSSATSRHVSVVAPTCYAWDRPMMDDA